MKFGAAVVAEELRSVAFASSLHPPHRYLAANQRVWRGKKENLPEAEMPQNSQIFNHSSLTNSILL